MSAVTGPKTLEELTRRVYEALPAGVEQLQADVKRNIRATLEAALARMDLVSREEFDVQTAVLLRSREKIEALEKKVAELEQTVSSETAKQTRKTERPPSRKATSGRRRQRSRDG